MALWTLIVGFFTCWGICGCPRRRQRQCDSDAALCLTARGLKTHHSVFTLDEDGRLTFSNFAWLSGVASGSWALRLFVPAKLLFWSFWALRLFVPTKLLFSSFKSPSLMTCDDAKWQHKIIHTKVMGVNLNVSYSTRADGFLWTA